MRIGNTITNPGQLRTSISLEEPTVSQDAGGFTTRGYTARYQVKARWRNLHGTDLLTANVQASRNPARVLIRYKADINPSWTVVKGGVRYEIIGMDNIAERGEYIELTVQTVTGG